MQCAASSRHRIGLNRGFSADPSLRQLGKRPVQHADHVGALVVQIPSGQGANAETQYAGSGPGSAHTASSNAVSQYDVACYQLSDR